MKKAIRLISGVVAFVLLTVSLFVPITVSAADYTAPEEAKFITDVNAGRILAGINPGTTVSDLETMFSGYDLSVKNILNTTVTTDTKIGTGFGVTVSLSGATVDTFTTIVYGDVNGDGDITIMDATAIQLHIAQLEMLPEDKLACADTDGDGKIAIMDATQIQLFIAQLIPEL